MSLSSPSGSTFGAFSMVYDVDILFPFRSGCPRTCNSRAFSMRVDLLDVFIESYALFNPFAPHVGGARHYSSAVTCAYASTCIAASECSFLFPCWRVFSWLSSHSFCPVF